MSALVILSLVLSVLSIVLHAVAKFTATKVDDEAADIVDAVKDNLPKQ